MTFFWGPGEESEPVEQEGLGVTALNHLGLPGPLQDFLDMYCLWKTTAFFKVKSLQIASVVIGLFRVTPSS